MTNSTEEIECSNSTTSRQSTTWHDHHFTNDGVKLAAAHIHSGGQPKESGGFYLQIILQPQDCFQIQHVGGLFNKREKKIKHQQVFWLVK